MGYGAPFTKMGIPILHIDGLVQDCVISTAKTQEMPEFCTRPSV